MGRGCPSLHLGHPRLGDGPEQRGCSFQAWCCPCLPSCETLGQLPPSPSFRCLICETGNDPPQVNDWSQVFSKYCDCSGDSEMHTVP